jgi:nicotinate-nucleotide pyrophosphorylase (carboxylating)
VSTARDPSLSSQWKSLFLQSLRDDCFEQDLSSQAILAGGANKTAEAKVVSKADGIWAAQGLLDLLESFAKEHGKTLTVTSHFKDGSVLKKGDVVCNWNGPSELILAYERSFLNLASYISGIATQTSQLVRQIKLSALKQKPELRHTRKFLPYFRDLAIHAVKLGGGHVHRRDLSSAIMLKENHLALMPTLEKALESALNNKVLRCIVEVEVKNIEELKRVATLAPDIVMLDNFSPEQVQTAILWLESQNKKPLVEVSGGIDLNSIKDYLIEGVNIISVGSITHSVKALDLSLLVES